MTNPAGQVDVQTGPDSDLLYIDIMVGSTAGIRVEHGHVECEELNPLPNEQSSLAEISHDTEESWFVLWKY